MGTHDVSNANLLKYLMGQEKQTKLHVWDIKDEPIFRIDYLAVLVIGKIAHCFGCRIICKVAV
jgi:hypothetical protein